MTSCFVQNADKSGWLHALYKCRLKWVLGSKWTRAYLVNYFENYVTWQVWLPNKIRISWSNWAVVVICPDNLTWPKKRNTKSRPFCGGHFQTAVRYVRYFNWIFPEDTVEVGWQLNLVTEAYYEIEKKLSRNSLGTLQYQQKRNKSCFHCHPKLPLQNFEHGNQKSILGIFKILPWFAHCICN